MENTLNNLHFHLKIKYFRLWRKYYNEDGNDDDDEVHNLRREKNRTYLIKFRGCL